LPLPRRVLAWICHSTMPFLRVTVTKVCTVAWAKDIHACKGLHAGEFAEARAKCETDRKCEKDRKCEEEVG
jgi:hypothetical protein